MRPRSMTPNSAMPRRVRNVICRKIIYYFSTLWGVGMKSQVNSIRVIHPHARVNIILADARYRKRTVEILLIETLNLIQSRSEIKRLRLSLSIHVGKQIVVLIL